MKKFCVSSLENNTKINNIETSISSLVESLGKLEFSLNDLVDVSVNESQPGNVLVYDGAEWKSSALSIPQQEKVQLIVNSVYDVKKLTDFDDVEDVYETEAKMGSTMLIEGDILGDDCKEVRVRCPKQREVGMWFSVMVVDKRYSPSSREEEKVKIVFDSRVGDVDNAVVVLPHHSVEVKFVWIGDKWIMLM